jgi:hypothetical protein
MNFPLGNSPPKYGTHVALYRGVLFSIIK